MHRKIDAYCPTIVWYIAMDCYLYEDVHKVPFPQKSVVKWSKFTVLRLHVDLNAMIEVPHILHLPGFASHIVSSLEQGDDGLSRSGLRVRA